MYDDRLEIKSPGQLPPDIDLNRIETTILVNPIVAAVFYLCQYAEKVGMGINIAQKTLRERGIMPAKIESRANPPIVKVTIERPNYRYLARL